MQDIKSKFVILTIIVLIATGTLTASARGAEGEKPSEIVSLLEETNFRGVVFAKSFLEQSQDPGEREEVLEAVENFALFSDGDPYDKADAADVAGARSVLETYGSDPEGEPHWNFKNQIEQLNETSNLLIKEAEAINERVKADEMSAADALRLGRIEKTVGYLEAQKQQLLDTAKNLRWMPGGKINDADQDVFQKNIREVLEKSGEALDAATDYATANGDLESASKGTTLIIKVADSLSETEQSGAAEMINVAAATVPITSNKDDQNFRREFLIPIEESAKSLNAVEVLNEQASMALHSYEVWYSEFFADTNVSDSERKEKTDLFLRLGSAFEASGNWEDALAYYQLADSYYQDMSFFDKLGYFLRSPRTKINQLKDAVAHSARAQEQQFSSQSYAVRENQYAIAGNAFAASGMQNELTARVEEIDPEADRYQNLEDYSVQNPEFSGGQAGEKNIFDALQLGLERSRGDLAVGSFVYPENYLGEGFDEERIRLMIKDDAVWPMLLYGPVSRGKIQRIAERSTSGQSFLSNFRRQMTEDVRRMTEGERYQDLLRENFQLVLKDLELVIQAAIDEVDLAVREQYYDDTVSQLKNPALKDPYTFVTGSQQERLNNARRFQQLSGPSKKVKPRNQD